MTGPIPFTSHPRRVVHGPGGPAMVAIRRNRYRRTSFFADATDLFRQLAFLGRRLGGDRSWLVELFDGVDQDLGALPLQVADQRWVVPDHEAAVAGAEALCGRLRRGEAPGL